jgi:hypothetical protein
LGAIIDRLHFYEVAFSKTYNISALKFLNLVSKRLGDAEIWVTIARDCRFNGRKEQVVLLSVIMTTHIERLLVVHAATVKSRALN